MFIYKSLFNIVAARKNIQTYKYGEKQQKAKEKKQRASVGYMPLCYTR